MKTLKTYISIIDPNLLRKISGKPAELVRLLQTNTYISDEAFCEAVCGGKHTRKYYTNLKLRTLKILESLLFATAPPPHSLLKKKYDFCLKNFLIGQKLIARHKQSEGITVMKRAYIVARDYEFYHLAVELSSLIHYHHVYYSKNQKQAELFAAHTKEYLHQYSEEKKAEVYFLKAINQRGRSTDLKGIETGIGKLTAMKSDNTKCKFYEFMLRIVHGFNTLEYGTITDNCTKALTVLKNKKGAFAGQLFTFRLFRGIANVALKKYSQADFDFRCTDDYPAKKSFNHYVLQFYQTINALHAGDYLTAYAIYRENKNCRYDLIRQQFAIIEAYLCFLSYAGHLKLTTKFRLGKYLNETFKQQADKKGDNIAILISELLVYLARDRSKYIDRVEAIAAYSYKHLNDPATNRAR
ncbi:MAG: hypothetical protein AAGG75_12150 [Bacteroidota bacterium]